MIKKFEFPNSKQMKQIRSHAVHYMVKFLHTAILNFGDQHFLNEKEKHFKREQPGDCLNSKIMKKANFKAK